MPDAMRHITTRMDEAILEWARAIAAIEQRPITSLIELAIIEYAERRGEPPPARISDQATGTRLSRST